MSELYDGHNHRVSPKPFEDRSYPSLEGFVTNLILHDKSRQTQLLKFGLERLAREYPNEDPRTVLIEWLTEQVYLYEVWRRRIRRKLYGEKERLDCEISRSDDKQFKDLVGGWNSSEGHFKVDTGTVEGPKPESGT